MKLLIILISALSLNITHANTLKQCPDKPNCVSSVDKDVKKQMTPISFNKGPIIQKIKDVVLKMDNTKLVKEEGNYLHFTFTSGLFKFVDDVEFIIDRDNNLINFRSASRSGYYDFGVNRKRMQEISSKLTL